MLIILGVELDLQAILACGGIDLFHSDLHTSLNSSTVNGSAAGQGAGHTDLQCGGCGFFLTATSEHGSDHNNCQHES